MKREASVPIVVGAIIVVLGLIIFFYWRSNSILEPHETPAHAKNPEDNPMFKGMKDSMRKAPSSQTPVSAGER